MSDKAYMLFEEQQKLRGIDLEQVKGVQGLKVRNQECCALVEFRPAA